MASLTVYSLLLATVALAYAGAMSIEPFRCEDGGKCLTWRAFLRDPDPRLRPSWKASAWNKAIEHMNAYEQLFSRNSPSDAPLVLDEPETNDLKRSPKGKADPSSLYWMIKVPGR